MMLERAGIYRADCLCIALFEVGWLFLASLVEVDFESNIFSNAGLSEEE